LVPGASWQGKQPETPCSWRVLGSRQQGIGPRYTYLWSAMGWDGSGGKAACERARCSSRPRTACGVAWGALSRLDSRGSPSLFGVESGRVMSCPASPRTFSLVGAPCLALSLRSVCVRASAGFPAALPCDSSKHGKRMPAARAAVKKCFCV
jgi:hypothetical protein